MSCPGPLVNGCRKGESNTSPVESGRKQSLNPSPFQYKRLRKLPWQFSGEDFTLQHRGFHSGSDDKECTCVIQESQISCLSREDFLEKGRATHSGILAWRIP